MTDKPSYRYWVDPRKEGQTDVQAIVIMAPDGSRLGVTQKWKGVTALEMAKDYIECVTDLVWPQFECIPLLGAHVMPPELMRDLVEVIAYMEEDEHRDYDEKVAEQGEDSQKGHMWLSLQRLTAWVEGR